MEAKYIISASVLLLVIGLIIGLVVLVVKMNESDSGSDSGSDESGSVDVRRMIQSDPDDIRGEFE
jgi:hypothetical protein